MSDFADYVLALVRTQLKRHPAFAGVRRDDLDVYLGDLERDIRRELEDWAAGMECVAYEDARYDLEFEAEERAAAKKERRPKAPRRQKREEHHADR